MLAKLYTNDQSYDNEKTFTFFIYPFFYRGFWANARNGNADFSQVY